MDELDKLIEQGWEKQLSDQDLVAFFKDLYSNYPKNPRLSYELGGVYDYLGREEEAITLYEEALNLGISGSFRVKTLIQMGSTLRNLGEFVKSQKTLEIAVDESGGDPASIIFLSLTLLSSGKEKEAALLALHHIYSESSGLVQRYKRSIGNYLEEVKDE